MITKEEITKQLLNIRIKVISHNHDELKETIKNLGLTGEPAQDYYHNNFKAEFDMDAVNESKRLFSQLRNLRLQNPSRSFP